MLAVEAPYIKLLEPDNHAPYEGSLPHCNFHYHNQHVQYILRQPGRKWKQNNTVKQTTALVWTTTMNVKYLFCTLVFCTLVQIITCR